MVNQSNIIEYKDSIAFHPGYYIVEIIEDMGISQADFAQRLGVTPQVIHALVNGKCSLSNNLVRKLSNVLGTGSEVWHNLQMKYDKMVTEIEKQKKHGTVE